MIENTPFSEKELVLLILTGPTRYKDHWIEKRHGRGKRLISQPTAELKLLSFTYFMTLKQGGLLSSKLQ